jgi:hypothetical protein
MTASERSNSARPINPVRHCPKCGSIRVHRSRRHGPIENLLTALGGTICRCHDCCVRKVWFGLAPLPIGNWDPEAPRWGGLAVFGSSCAALGLVWWAVTRFAGSF